MELAYLYDHLHVQATGTCKSADGTVTNSTSLIVDAKGLISGTILYAVFSVFGVAFLTFRCVIEREAYLQFRNAHLSDRTCFVVPLDSCLAYI